MNTGGVKEQPYQADNRRNGEKLTILGGHSQITQLQICTWEDFEIIFLF